MENVILQLHNFGQFSSYNPGIAGLIDLFLTDVSETLSVLKVLGRAFSYSRGQTAVSLDMRCEMSLLITV